MAEFLGVVASGVTVAEAGAKLTRLIKSFNNAPRELENLLGIVQELSVVMRVIETSWDAHKVPPPAALELWKKTEDRLNKLKSILDLVDQGGNANLSTCGRMQWLLKKVKTQQLQKELEDSLQRLSFALQAGQAADTLETKLKMRDLDWKLQALQSQNMAMLLSLTEHHPANPKIAHHSKVEDLPESTAVENLPRGDLPVPHTALSATLLQRHRNRRICFPTCSCVCHTRRSLEFGLPSSTGRFHIEYTGSLPGFSGCTSRSCLSTPKTIAVGFVPPNWVLAQILSLTFVQSQYSGPQLSLKARNVVSQHAPIFQAVCEGNIEKVKDLLESGLARVDDVDDVVGQTALWHSYPDPDPEIIDPDLQRAAQNMQKLLVTAGSDPMYENAGESSYFRMTVQLTFCGRANDHNGYLPIFSASSLAETCQFNALHKCVLKILSCPLENLIRNNLKEINNCDLEGSTPLLWACHTMNVEAVELLLAYGADPDLVNDVGTGPIMATWFITDPALQDKKVRIIDLLLQPAVRIDLTVQPWGRTLLHHAWDLYGIACDKLLRATVAAGVDVNVRDEEGRTPLIETAAFFRHIDPLIWLIHAGANVNLHDDDGMTAVGYAIHETKHAQAANLLVQHGAVLTEEDEIELQSLNVKDVDSKKQDDGFVRTVLTKEEETHEDPPHTWQMKDPAGDDGLDGEEDFFEDAMENTASDFNRRLDGSLSMCR